MAPRGIILITIAFVAAACASAQPHYYTLDSTPAPASGPAAKMAVMVGPVTVPASVDQPQFVIQAAANRVEVEEFNRWASPLNEGIARAVAGDLAAQLGTPDVVAAPLANFTPDYQVAIDVQRFESIRGEAAVLEAVWVVRKRPAGRALSGSTVAREPVQGDSFDALAAAHSRALVKLSADIAAAIRSEAETGYKS